MTAIQSEPRNRAATANRPTGEATADGNLSGGDEPLSGRAATEAALEEAATMLLKRDGVLAGLNLREVADEAGVNRGLVYHYYGSRGKLLRRALRRRGHENLVELAAQDSLPFRQRWSRFFRTTVTHPEPIALTTLLVLDGTEPIRVMPLRDSVQKRLRQDVERGEIDPDVDLVAFHALLVTAAYGYTLYRESFARELGVDVDDLDARVGSLIFDRIIPAVTPDAHRASDASE
jgi:AcrR family transcriptional regulator